MNTDELKAALPVLDMNWCMIALKEVNRKVAACFNHLPVEVTFKFVNYIKVEERRTKKGIYKSVVLGEADVVTHTVTLLTTYDWQKTAVHELIHIYEPRLTEKEVCQTTTETIKYLLSFRDE